jgi:hypothetical protein
VGRNDGADAESPIQRILIPATIKRKEDVAHHDADLIARFIRRAILREPCAPRIACGYRDLLATSALCSPTPLRPLCFLLFKNHRLARRAAH